MVVLYLQVQFFRNHCERAHDRSKQQQSKFDDAVWKQWMLGYVVPVTCLGWWFTQDLKAVGNIWDIVRKICIT